MKPWQFDAAFVVALALLVFFAVAPYLGLEDAAPSPLVVSGVGALLGFVFTRKDQLTRNTNTDDDEPDQPAPPRRGGHRG